MKKIKFKVISTFMEPKHKKGQIINVDEKEAAWLRDYLHIYRELSTNQGASIREL